MITPLTKSIADLEREGDVDVVQLRVLDARDLMGSISSCSSFAMQNGGATPTRGNEAAALDQKNRGECYTNAQH
jgi:hypothetical protein